MAKANWKWQQPVGKSRKQICHGKSKLYTEEVPNSWRTPKIVQDKSKNRFWSQKQKASDKSKLVTSLQLITATYHVTKANSFVAKANHLRVAQKQQLVPMLPLDPFRRTGCKVARHWILRNILKCISILGFFLKNMCCRFHGGMIAIERTNFCQRCGKGRIAIFYLDYSCCCFKKVIEFRLPLLRVIEYS